MAPRQSRGLEGRRRIRSRIIHQPPALPGGNRAHGIPRPSNYGIKSIGSILAFLGTLAQYIQETPK
ncbi:hypothetical protein CA54_13510 [Symmachiella macrocystis]|uniref:Uncharacterized protein n=1 Tax=Symmachiella macrocystis TaxID=2527985 RepID=A0A5C6BLH8_9PLAN|nr:hypothetical protein CA54_13510 [Symmachiella macrocystis]